MLVFPVLKAFPAGGITLRKSRGPEPSAQLRIRRRSCTYYLIAYRHSPAARCAVRLQRQAHSKFEQEGYANRSGVYCGESLAGSPSPHPRRLRPTMPRNFRTAGRFPSRRRLHGNPQAAARVRFAVTDAGLRHGGEQLRKARSTSSLRWYDHGTRKLFSCQTYLHYVNVVTRDDFGFVTGLRDLAPERASCSQGLLPTVGGPLTIASPPT
jgi:hypothetical protein